MKRLVLHIGMEKTGTSTIQDFLGHHSKALAQCYVFTPDWRPFNHSYDFTTLFMDSPGDSFLYKKSAPISDEDWEELLATHAARWREGFTSFDEGTYIISAENLFRCSRSEIQRIAEFAGPHFDLVEALVYVRNPVASIRSQWEQRVKQMDGPDSGEALLEKVKKGISFDFIARWGEILGNDNFYIRNFDKAVTRHENLAQDFLEALGLPPYEAELQEGQSANTSLGHEGTAFLLAYNAKYPLFRDGALNTERGLSKHIDLLYRAMRAVKTAKLDFEVRFTASEASAVNQQIALLNERLPDDARFAPVAASAEKTRLPSPDDIATSYHVELVNELSRLLELHIDPKQ